LVLILLGVNYEYGRQMQLPSMNPGDRRFVVVQPNVPMDGEYSEAFVRKILNQHIELSEKAIADFPPLSDGTKDDKPIIVIWSESPMNLRYNHDEELRQLVVDFVR